MKKLNILFLVLLVPLCVAAQQPSAGEVYAQSLNISAGTGYYRYVGYNVPVVHANYELPVDELLTVAPFAAFYRYETNYYWGDETHTPRYFHYSEKVLPIGIKVTGYLDELINAGKRWDFYAAGSIGLIIRKTSWVADYEGPRKINPGTGGMFLDFHVGTEFHCTRMLGIQLDCAAGETTLGLAFHFKNKTE
jgi:hypothetical protein